MKYSCYAITSLYITIKPNNQLEKALPYSNGLIKTDKHNTGFGVLLIEGIKYIAY